MKLSTPPTLPAWATLSAFGALLALGSLAGGGDGASRSATGLVFHDVDGDGERDAGEAGLPGVRVSNGRDVVATDGEGRYRLGVDDDTILFVLKPRGFRTALSADGLPRFYYVHKPGGSPASRFAGVAPTGPLPASVDFGLVTQDEPERFSVILFGDPQPRDQREVQFVTHDVVEELVGTDAAFGVTLGDIAFDDLDTFATQNAAIGVLGIPWYNVIGNHDLNFEAREDVFSDETFERVFGPPYYAFDHGPVHFVVLDNVAWGWDEARQRGAYQGALDAEQLEFVRNDLAGVPEDKLVVLLMHIPLDGTAGREALFRLIETRPFTLSISGHTHYHEHRFLDADDGWRGEEPHHHIVNVTVSGSWWAGLADERGIPHAVMADGTPNGYSILRFDGRRYALDYRAAGRPREHQMSIHAPEVVAPGEAARVVVNVFDGSERSRVEAAVGPPGSPSRAWVALDNEPQADPALLRLRAQEAALVEALEGLGRDPRKLLRNTPEPRVTPHMWSGNLPRGLAPGTHCLQVRHTDMHGRVHTGTRIFRVAAGDE